MKFIFIKYFLSYETWKLQSSALAETLNLLMCYFRIVNSSFFSKIIYADYFLSMDFTRTSVIQERSRMDFNAILI